MLRLKRLELQGFKSFVDRTELRFRGAGVTAVVGPNGCGKSNLADAISWVLGEQSAKTLRGSRMEDVIFAGTRDRKPLGLAAVNLTLVDPDADGVHATPNGANSPEKQSEVTITRRLYRSGDSEYLINGKHARLRDIQDLFSGTGLGPESYAIIEQGRITQILSNKPQERRAVIEEAAGIGKFKTRRRLAEAKLEGAKQNLSRVFDILEEVSRQVNSLKRQAAKAKRYEELKADMIAHLRRSLIGRYRMLEREAAKAALDLNLATREFQELSARVAGQDAQHVTLQETSYRIESELTEERKRLSETRLEAERTRSKLDYQARQIAEIEQRLNRGETETQELETRQGRLEEEFRGHERQLGEWDEQANAARGRLTARTQDRDRLQASLKEREQALESGRQQVLRLLGEESTLKNQLAQIAEYLSGIERETARASKEEQTATADLERLAAQKAQLAGRIAARQIELAAIADERRAVEQNLALQKQAAAETRRALDQLRGEHSRIRARKESLRDILAHRSYTTESVKRLFKAIEGGRARDLAPLGVLADFVEVDATYEKATEEFLHEELEYVVVRDWKEAERGIDLMRADLDGRATFLVHPEPEENVGPVAPHEPAIGPETGILSRLSHLLRLTNGLTKAPTELLPRLARCFLVEDRAAAQRLALLYPDLYFLLPDGVSYHGHAVSGGKKTGSGPLALKRELREVTGLEQAKQKEVDAASRKLEGLDAEIARLTDDLERLRGRQQSQEKDAVALDHEMRKLGEETSRSNSRQSVARLELQRLAQDVERARERRERSQKTVEDLESRRREQELRLETTRAELAELQGANARLAEEHSTLRAELAGLEERRRAELAARSRLEGQLREVTQRRRQIAEEMERLGVERARLLTSNIELDGRTAELTGQLLKLDASVAALAEREQATRAELAELEEALRKLRIDTQAAQEKRAQVELELVKRQAELKFLDETSRKELNAPLDELSQAEDTVLDESGLREAEQKYQEVRARIDALGPVNPDALQEFQEAQQRYDFLNTQRQDLLDSIRDTEKAIQDIDIESRRRFSDAFEAINAHFREMFSTLFNGGSGEMRLTNPDDLAESGVDIMASPPGKRLQNVLLLSGGERSLTAMALLLAIFRYQPSPFCVLDEVDAALDEANITKLVRLARDMSKQTQFIFITHARRTMEVAEAMYGVTMQEPGVSKVVSVKFQPQMPPPVEQEVAVLANA